MKAEEFDEAFDRGEDVTAHLDLSKARRPEERRGAARALKSEPLIRYTEGMDQHPRKFRIHMEPEPEGGYTVTVPTLPGCVTWGATYDEAVEMARECVEGFLSALVEAGGPLPAGDQ